MLGEPVRHSEDLAEETRAVMRRIGALLSE
jgi:hypothetical protein